MFSETSIIKEVNILTKVISFIVVLSILLIVGNSIYLLALGILFLAITKKFKGLFIFNLSIDFLVVLNIFFPHFMWIIKICFLILYILLVRKVTKLIELRYVIEVMLYKFNNKKITYKLFYIIYFLKNFNKHFKKMLILKDDYGIKVDYKFIIFIIKQSYIKAKQSKKDFFEINTIRYYNYSKDRTYIEDNKIESWDVYYLLTHALILTISIFFGR